MLTDTHCHLFYHEIKNDLANVLKRALELGVDRFICVATNIEDAKECLITFKIIFLAKKVYLVNAAWYI